MNGNTRLSSGGAAGRHLAACAVSPTGRRQLALVSEDSAIVASEEAYAMQIGELRKAGKIVSESSRVARRVEAITERLVAQAIEMRPETADWEWSMEVIDDPEVVNAWCMAGGRMAVYTGLIQKLDPTDDELAQVLAHEISHALANHTAERMSVALATNAGVLLAGVLSEDSQKNDEHGGLAAALAIQLPNSRPPNPKPMRSASSSRRRPATTRMRRSACGRRWRTSGAAVRRSS